ncbi:MAG: hypothetical protein NVS3B12_35220 [Acidimicrobiales bacterium]
MGAPLRAHPDRPVIDGHSEQVVADAVALISVLRSPMGQGHAGLRLHALASLIAQAEALLPDAVADARDCDFYWPEIARELGVSTAAAFHRYDDYTTTRKLPLDAD